MSDLRKQKIAEFTAWAAAHGTGDEKGEAQIFLDRLFQAFGQRGLREAGATLEMRVKRADAGGTAFADLVWKPVVLIEMKRCGTDLHQHYRQAFEYWTRLVPGRPRYVILDRVGTAGQASQSNRSLDTMRAVEYVPQVAKLVRLDEQAWNGEGTLS